MFLKPDRLVQSIGLWTGPDIGPDSMKNPVFRTGKITGKPVWTGENQENGWTGAGYTKPNGFF